MGDKNMESKKQEKMSFPLEKILTISAKDYCEMMDKRLSNYTAVGVHTYNGGYCVPHKLIRDQLNASEELLAETEVIVDYIGCISFGEGYNTSGACASGTALIPKK